ncbi:MAG: PIG-L deacetylase family protein [Thiotrichales bacterium]
MLPLLLDLPISNTPVFLFLGAHCDDIEIGTGALQGQLARQYPEARIHWVVFSGNPVRAEETRFAAKRFTSNLAEVEIHDFRNAFFPAEFASIKNAFEVLKQRFQPDVIFTHYNHDAHQDHRIISELTRNTFRSHLIFEYEIPKYDGDLGNPSVFIPVSRKDAEQKAAVLLEAFPSQNSRQWFSTETFMAIMRLRGIQCDAPEGYAEAFYTKKVALKL